MNATLSTGIPCRVCGWIWWRARADRGPVLVALDYTSAGWGGWWCLRCLERVGASEPPGALRVPDPLFPGCSDSFQRARRIRAAQERAA